MEVLIQNFSYITIPMLIMWAIGCQILYAPIDCRKPCLKFMHSSMAVNYVAAMFLNPIFTGCKVQYC